MLAWLTFWLNTALFPCCEALAAALEEHIEDRSQSVPVAGHAQHPEATHVERANNVPDAHCDSEISAGPAINGEFAGLLADRGHVEWDAVHASAIARPFAADVSVEPAARDYLPPPPARVRFYLRTQRLRI